jgi:hypothetical protein
LTEEDKKRILNRLKTIYVDLASPGTLDAKRQKELTELTRESILLEQALKAQEKTA